MRYYKIVKDCEIVGYQTHEEKLDYDFLEELSEKEYESAISVLAEQAESEITETELSKDERISELEKENAALLFQILTGEEYTDV